LTEGFLNDIIIISCNFFKKCGGDKNMMSKVRTTKNCYKTFGLNITSDFVFEELFESDGEPEIEILFGKTPNFIAGDTKGHTWFQACRNNMLVEVDNVARYHICDGNKITIEPKEDATIETIKLYLLSVAFASLLQQRKNFPLHGSALNIDGKAL
jgi:hypothetical protein